MNIYKKSKKSQFLVISSLFLFLLIIFTYSFGTENSYIIKKSKFNLLNNVISETCMVGKLSNGTNIEPRFSNLTLSFKNYCWDLGYDCKLEIVNNTQIPPSGDWTLLNYTHFNYFIDYDFDGFKYEGSFNC